MFSRLKWLTCFIALQTIWSFVQGLPRMWTRINTGLPGSGHLLRGASLTRLTARQSGFVCYSKYSMVWPTGANTVMQTGCEASPQPPVTRSTHYKAHESFWISKMLHSPLLPGHNNLTFNLSCRGEKKLSCHRMQWLDYRWSHNCRESQTNQIRHMQQQNRGE